MQTEKLTLLHAIQRGDESITEITLREPNSGALRGLRLTEVMNGDIDSIAALIPRICEPKLQKHEIDQLRAVDLTAVTGTIIGFFTPGEADIDELMANTE